MGNSNIKKCNECNNVNYKNSNFCKGCGTKFDNLEKCEKCRSNNVRVGHKSCEHCLKMCNSNVYYNKDHECDHNICKILKNNNTHKLCFVLPLVKDDKKDVQCWLGIDDKNECNIIGGKCFNNCYFRTGEQELYDKLKVDVEIDENTQYIIHNDIPIFLVKLPNSTTKEYYQNEMKKELNNILKSDDDDDDEINIVDIGVVNIKNFSFDDNQTSTISGFAKCVINNIDEFHLRILGLD